MNKKKIAISVFSNWAVFAVAILVAFIVSPIMVRQLGNETYGIWVLMVSIGSYFTVFDFGINTALVRFISKYTALERYHKAAKIYSSSFVFFLAIGAVILVVIAILGLFFKDFFNVEAFSHRYLYFVLIIIGIDLTINLVFSVFQGTLRGLQNFLQVNIVLISTNLVKNTILVYLLLNGHSILSLAILQTVMSVLKYLAFYLYIKHRHRFLEFKVAHVQTSTFKQLFDYSIYSFLIALSLKVLFYTDSIVIGSMVSLEGVTFYAIPGMIVENLKLFIWAAISVMIPIISSREAVGRVEGNAELYVIGTKYTLLLCAPIIFVLLIIGDDFIGLWMGQSYAEPSGQILTLLLIGYIFALSQLVAQGILKGISRHKVLAYILCVEAVLNLGLSIMLAPSYGIRGVAIGSMIPLLLSNILLIPYFTCRELKISYCSYLTRAIIKPLAAIVVLFVLVQQFDIQAFNFTEVILYSLLVTLILGVYGICFQLESEHRVWLIFRVRNLISHIRSG